MLNLKEEFDSAKFVMKLLISAGYDAYIVGGALRAQVLNGATNDVDIAVIVDGQREAEKLHNDLRILLDRLGYNFKLRNQSDYNNVNAFLADWRSGNINIIAYDKNFCIDIKTLVSHFDLNINSFYTNGDDIINDHIDLDNVVVKALEHNSVMCGRLRECRVVRFKEQYPHLDWSNFQ